MYTWHIWYCTYLRYCVRTYIYLTPQIFKRGKGGFSETVVRLRAVLPNSAYSEDGTDLTITCNSVYTRSWLCENWYSCRCGAQRYHLFRSLQGRQHRCVRHCYRYLFHNRYLKHHFFRLEILRRSGHKFPKRIFLERGHNLSKHVFLRSACVYHPIASAASASDSSWRSSCTRATSSVLL